MNEDETRAELIDPALKAVGWGVVEESRVLRGYRITEGKLLPGCGRAKPLVADYVLVYKNRKIAVVEAKKSALEVGEGVAQAKNYAEKLHIDYTYSSNGREIYQISMKSGREGLVKKFPTPEELWQKTFSEQTEWEGKFNQIPFESASKGVRSYQEIAVNKVLNAIAGEKRRILLTMATGTGKTFIAFQIAWKLFQTRWNLQRDGQRRPRILFLADRNILANQAFNSFSAFPEDALVRINPRGIRKKGSVPMNGSVFFTIFQTFMCGDNDTPYFGDYPADYFDLIIIDECHRGGANDESNWRGIMEYFEPAVQIGLTATPKRKENADTYKYFGDPVYMYSLKEGINDGYLTPFKVKRISTTLDTYIYAPDDQIVEGQVEEGRIYYETDFNRIIKIREREAKRVQLFLDEMNQKEKTIVFCANQPHAAEVRDLIGQLNSGRDANYCRRVTANDAELGEQYLREFQDNEKTLPTILTTSQKLSTGVDALNIRNIVLLRPIGAMIEFKQIIGRGTRLFDGKEYFTIYDFVGAYHHFLDPEWDGEPIEPDSCANCGKYPCECEATPPKLCSKCGEIPCECEKPLPNPCAECGEMPCKCIKKVKIKLRDGKEREIQHMIATSYWSADGKLMSLEEYLNALCGDLPKFFKNEDELRALWSKPDTRRALLEKLAEAGYGQDKLSALQKMINAEKSDLFDVLEYISFAIPPLTRETRVSGARSQIFDGLDKGQKEFLDFVLFKYIETGVEELDDARLPNLLQLKYHSLADGAEALGGADKIRAMFIGFQKHLYNRQVA